MISLNGLESLEKSGSKCKVGSNKGGKKLTGKQLLAVLAEVCKNDSIIMTDEFKGYNALKSTKHIHLRIDHQREFASGDIHTNSIESFWSQLKRSIDGTYHQISEKYLQTYVDEFAFRYNHRLSSQHLFAILADRI